MNFESGTIHCRGMRSALENPQQPRSFDVRNRLQSREILDDWEPPAEVLRQSYRELDRLHRWLGNRAAVLRELRRLGVGRHNRVLDVGCGQGALLEAIRRRFGCEVVGADLRGGCATSTLPIVQADAVRDALPKADVAVCVVMAHHLDPAELQAMIQNIARSCGALILLDLVRHPVPLILFRMCVAPLLSRINAMDGETSVRRAYTPQELRQIVQAALPGCPHAALAVRFGVAPFWLRQTVVVEWQKTRNS